MDDLTAYRNQIDQLDAQLIALLGQRMQITHKVGIHKMQQGLTARNQAREDAQAARIAELAKQYGLDPAYAEQVLRMIIDEAVKEQEATRAGASGA